MEKSTKLATQAKRSHRSNGQAKKSARKRYKYYDARYGDSEDWKPKPVKKLNMDDHRHLPKGFVFDDELSLAAKAVYPAMCCRANYKVDKPFKVSQKDIGRMTGLSVSTVKKALTELRRVGLVRARKGKGDTRVWEYRVWFLRKNEFDEWKGMKFLFHRCIVESGLWKELTLRQQVFWLGLRAVGKPDPDLHREIMELVEEYGHTEPYERWYGERLYDVWSGSRRRLLERIGIADVNIRREVIAPLEDAGLVQQLPSDYRSAFKVFIRPIEVLEEYYENPQVGNMLCEY